MARPCHIKNLIAYYSACSRKTLNPTPVQPLNTPHRDVKRQKASSEMLSHSRVEKFPDLKVIHWKNCEDMKMSYIKQSFYIDDFQDLFKCEDILAELILIQIS